LARTILGLEKPSAGRVRYRGNDLGYGARALKAYRREVQLVLQDPTGSLNPRHTVYEAVAEGLRVHKVPGNERELVAEALSRAGLRPPDRYFLRYPHELSGGQRQRVVIAGALVLEPKVIVADEPVSSLDASVRGEILALLLKLREELGLTILVVTHDLGLAWNIADRLAVMYLGRVVEIGRTEEVLDDPQHPYTRALLSVVPEVQHLEPIVLQGETPDPTRIPDGCRFNPRCPALASGEAAAAGVATSCTTTPLEMLSATQAHQAACFLSAATRTGHTELSN
jgi:oligopeptide/dipeptide ABC transporter ATP-binding protein